ncbi:cell division protein FtsX [Desulfovulcanus sp.]
MIAHLLLRGVKNLAENKGAQVLTIGAVTLVAFLCGLFMLVLFNFKQIIGSSQNKVQFQIYWKRGLPLSRVHKDWDQIASWPEVKSIKTFTPDQALEMLAQTFSDDSKSGGRVPGEASSSSEVAKFLVEDNPLPPTALVEVELARPLAHDDGGGSEGEDQAKTFLDHLKTLPAVDKVTFNPLQVDLARTWLKISHAVIWPLIIFMLSLMGMVVGNTLRLFHLSHQEEVEILNLIGASKAYIQFPILVTGAAQSLIGGTLALIILKLMHFAIQKILYVPPFWLKISFLPLPYVGLFLAVLILVGIISGLLAGQSSYS